jgi:hypothetical protein
MIHTLYKTTNLVNNRIYIGVHCTEDVGFGTDTWLDDYIGSGKSVTKALEKYNRENFKVEVIAYFDTEDAAYKAEAFIVDDIFVKRRDTYNRCLGGGGSGIKLRGKPKTEEHKAKLRGKRKPIGPMSEEHKNKLRKPKSSEHIENIRLSKLGSKNPMFGKGPNFGSFKKGNVIGYETRFKERITV